MAKSSIQANLYLSTSRACLNVKTVFPGMGIPIIKIRRS